MRVECPNCKAGGNVNELAIPEEGISLSCPRCKHGFHVAKPRKKMTSAFATNTCPACGYSTFCEEVFDECPQCGVMVKTLIERKREEDARKREQELLHRNYRAEAGTELPLPAGPTTATQIDTIEKHKVSLAGFADGFNPVAAVGWGMVVAAAIMLVMGGVGLLHYLGTDIQAQLAEQSVEPVSAWQVFWGYGFLPWSEVVVGGGLLVLALGFLQRASWGLRAIQGAVQGLLVLIPLYELVQYIGWIANSVAPPWWAYLIELFSSLLVSLLCMAPLYFLLRYLQGAGFKKEYQQN